MAAVLKAERADQSSPAAGLGVGGGNTADLIVRINAGFPYSVLERFRESSDLSMQEIARAMRVPPQTLTRRAKDKKLNMTESERLLRLSRLFEKAVHLFGGDRNGATAWFRQPERAFEGASPLEMAETEVGAREVENLIGQLEHGVFP